MSKKIFPIVAIALPGLVLAADLGSLITSLKTTILDKLVGVLLTVALLVFFWGMIRYIRSEGSDKKQGKDIMVWGIVALFVMVSVWGLVNVLIDTFGFRSTNNRVPRIPLPSTTNSSALPDIDPGREMN
jgi:uncharacterized membrane protein YfcA